MFKRVASFLSALGIDGFLFFLGLAILLAWLTPTFGVEEGPFSLRTLAHYGIWLIFFFYGVGMDLRTLWGGLTHWQLHLVVHAMTFLVFPLLVLPLYQLFQTESTRLLWLGIFYIAALPSTVSSSVVMVSIARGNVPAAIFNASISSLLGVFLTPLWMSLVLTTQKGNFDLSGAVQGLFFVVVLPVFLGMALNPKLGGFVAKNRKYLRYFDQSVVLLIVYTSFCESFVSKAFDGFGPKTILLLCFGMIALFFLVYAIVGVICRTLHFNREDTIAVRFCGSKKSLMHGTAMAKVLFPGMEGLGVVLLPLMLYHALQLILVSVIAKRLAREVRPNESK